MHHYILHWDKHKVLAAPKVHDVMFWLLGGGGGSGSVGWDTRPRSRGLSAQAPAWAKYRCPGVPTADQGTPEWGTKPTDAHTESMQWTGDPTRGGPCPYGQSLVSENMEPLTFWSWLHQEDSTQHPRWNSVKPACTPETQKSKCIISHCAPAMMDVIQQDQGCAPGWVDGWRALVTEWKTVLSLCLHSHRILLSPT